MKFVIAGAGAVGAYLGACMARDGQDVVLLARGPHYRAMKENGVRVESANEDFVVRPEVVESLDQVGPADVVFLAVKARSLTEFAPSLAPIIDTDTVVVSTQNGIPWWYFQRLGGGLEGTLLEILDPGGKIAASIAPELVVGSIVYFSSEITKPGVVRLIEGNRISLGEPDGSRSKRVRRIAAALVGAGLRAPVTSRIRHEIWVKLLGNMSFNPISALTGATIAGMLRDPGVADLVRNMMREASAVAAAVGIELPVSIDQRIAGAARVGEHKTSMLQDLTAGRPMEIEALVGSVVELGARLGIDMPHTRAVYACTRLLESTQNR